MKTNDATISARAHSARKSHELLVIAAYIIAFTVSALSGLAAQLPIWFLGGLGLGVLITLPLASPLVRPQVRLVRHTAPPQHDGAISDCSYSMTVCSVWYRFLPIRGRVTVFSYPMEHLVGTHTEDDVTRFPANPSDDLTFVEKRRGECPFARAPGSTALGIRCPPSSFFLRVSLLLPILPWPIWSAYYICDQGKEADTFQVKDWEHYAAS